MGCMGCFLTGLPPGSTKGSEFICHCRKLTSALEALWKLLCTAILFLKDKFCAKGKRQEVNRRGAVVAAQVCASAPVHLVRASFECQPSLSPPALQPQIKKFRQGNAQIPLCRIPGSGGLYSHSLIPPAQIPWNHESSISTPTPADVWSPRGSQGEWDPQICCVWGWLLWEPGASLPCRFRVKI